MRRLHIVCRATWHNCMRDAVLRVSVRDILHVIAVIHSSNISSLPEIVTSPSKREAIRWDDVLFAVFRRTLCMQPAHISALWHECALYIIFNRWTSVRRVCNVSVYYLHFYLSPLYVHFSVYPRWKRMLKISIFNSNNKILTLRAFKHEKTRWNIYVYECPRNRELTYNYRFFGKLRANFCETLHRHTNSQFSTLSILKS